MRKEMLIHFAGAMDVIKRVCYTSFEMEKEVVKRISKNEYSRILGDFLDEKICNDTAIDLCDKILFDYLDMEKDIDWSEVGVFLGKDNVFKILDHFKYSIPDKDYWCLIRYCYVMSDFCYSDFNTLSNYLECNRPEQQNIMTEDDRGFLASLPNEFKVYRGCSIAEIESGLFRYSWSLDVDVARFFAYEYRRNSHLDCKVVEKTIKKNDVLAYFSGRKESEILMKYG
jgi:hypothetical protein